MEKIALLLIISFLLLSSCQKEELSSFQNPNNSLLNSVDFNCGVAVDISKLNSNSEYNQIVKNQFNSITAENIMKPAYLHPGENTYFWTEADELVDFCIANSKRLHGHTLIWHQQIPDWMLIYQGSEEDWENLLKDHIFQIVGHFKGKVASWDVVNEAFNEDGTLRASIWTKNIGESYIEKAFKYAREADPNAILFYNDYSIESNPVKRTAILNYLNNLKAKGTPIDGIGIQMHISLGFPGNSEISQTIKDIWENDYLVHISELDISINYLSIEMPVALNDDLIKQADKYLYIFKEYDEIPEKYKFGITIWGVSDGDSWIRYFFNRDDYPLLYDDNYHAKPAFNILITKL